MLYVFYGTDTLKVADQTSRLVANLLVKRPDAQVFSFESGAVSERDIDELVEAQGLFVEKHIIVLKQMFDVAESRDMIMERLEKFASTKNVIVVSENKLLAAHKKALTKHATKIEEHKKEVVSEVKFNVFSLADALGARNKRGLWTGYVQALRAGLEPESIHGTLHWAVKAMMIASKVSSADEAGQKSFTYNNYKRFAGNYTKKELGNLSKSLISIYHEARHGKHDLKVALEKWCLAV